MVGMNSKKGFTLMELLVVISIIALLLSILLPALTKVKKIARRTVCSSNFRQIGLINQTYASDHGTYLPRFANNFEDVYKNKGKSIDAVVPYLMPEMIWDYLNNSYQTEAKFWICPSLLGSGGKEGFLADSLDNDELKSWADSTGFRRYWIGIAHLTGIQNVVGAEPSTLEVSAYSPLDKNINNKLLAVDLNIKWAREWSNTSSVVAHLGRKGWPEGGNRLYADGHVEWVSPDSMAEDDTPIEERNRGKFDHWKGGPGREYYW